MPTFTLSKSTLKKSTSKLGCVIVASVEIVAFSGPDSFETVAAEYFASAVSVCNRNGNGRWEKLDERTRAFFDDSLAVAGLGSEDDSLQKGSACTLVMRPVRPVPGAPDEIELSMKAEHDNCKAFSVSASRDRVLMRHSWQDWTSSTVPTSSRAARGRGRSAKTYNTVKFSAGVKTAGVELCGLSLEHAGTRVVTGGVTALSANDDSDCDDDADDYDGDRESDDDRESDYTPDASAAAYSHPAKRAREGPAAYTADEHRDGDDHRPAKRARTAAPAADAAGITLPFDFGALDTSAAEPVATTAEPAATAAVSASFFVGASVDDDAAFAADVQAAPLADTDMLIGGALPPSSEDTAFRAMRTDVFAGCMPMDDSSLPANDLLYPDADDVMMFGPPLISHFDDQLSQQQIA